MRYQTLFAALVMAVGVVFAAAAASLAQGIAASPSLPQTAAPVLSGSFIEDSAPPVAAAAKAALPLSAGLSPINMFVAADWVVKAVIIGLLLASSLSWVIFIAKSLSIAAARRQALAVLQAVLEAQNLGSAAVSIAERPGAGAQLVQAALAEAEFSQAAVKTAGNAGLKERVASSLAAIVLQAARQATKTIGIVATIGSVAPFIGLFGTVWGIMNSFINIAEMQTSSLAVVAPGIAEALLATAIGLFAAIPATIMYNIFVRSIAFYRQILTNIAAAVERLVSRDLDFAAFHGKNGEIAGNEIAAKR